MAMSRFLHHILTKHPGQAFRLDLHQQIDKEFIGRIDWRIHKSYYEILQVYVSPELRKQRIGTYLIQYVNDDAKKNEITGIILNSTQKAIGFWKAQKFQPVSDSDIPIGIKLRYWANPAYIRSCL